MIPCLTSFKFISAPERLVFTLQKENLQIHASLFQGDQVTAKTNCAHRQCLPSIYLTVLCDLSGGSETSVLDGVVQA